MLARGWLLVAVAVVAAACGGVRADPAAQAPGSPSVFTAVDEQMALDAEQRAGLAEAGFHTEGLLQGLPASCRIAEQASGPDGRLARRIVAALTAGGSRGPLVAVDASDATTVLATTLVAADGTVGDTAAWTATEGDPATIHAANPPAAELTTFELVPVDQSGDTPASSVMAEAVDCSWVVADVTHADPPQPTPQLRPDLLELDPAQARPEQLVAMRFPQQTLRGLAFELDRHTGQGWTTVAWMTSDANGDDPVTVPAGTDGYGVNDVGVTGPGPDRVRLPDDAPPGDYRICTANAAEDFCAPLEIVTTPADDHSGGRPASPGLECRDPDAPTEHGNIDYAHTADGDSDDPVDTVRRWLGGTDVDGLEFAPPSGPNPDVVTDVLVRRDGRVIARVQVADAPGGDGLLVTSFDGCREFNPNA